MTPISRYLRGFGRSSSPPARRSGRNSTGAGIRPQSSAQFGDLIRDEKARSAKVVKESGEKFE